MTRSRPSIGGSRNWSGLVRPRQKEFGGKKLEKSRSLLLAGRRAGFRERLSLLSGRHQPLQRRLVVDDQGRALEFDYVFLSEF